MVGPWLNHLIHIAACLWLLASANFEDIQPFCTGQVRTSVYMPTLNPIDFAQEVCKIRSLVMGCLTMVEEEGVMSNLHSFVNISILADDASALSCSAGVPSALVQSGRYVMPW